MIYALIFRRLVPWIEKKIVKGVRKERQEQKERERERAHTRDGQKNERKEESTYRVVLCKLLQKYNT